MFIIDLTYIVSLELIDEAMPEHLEYLERNFKKGYFVASGRKVPRTGGIILATSPNSDDLHELIKEDPFIRLNLASVTITEFTPTKSNECLKGIL